MSPSNSNIRWATIAIAVLAVVIAAVFVLRRPQQEEAEAAAPTADTGGLVPFRMEQQWLIHLKLATAEAATLAPQIHSTGRVVPVPCAG